MPARYELESGRYGPRMVLLGPWDDALYEDIQERGIVELYLNHAKGWKRSDLGFLENLTFLKWLNILDWMIEDLTPVLCLSNLRFLHLATSCKTKINFGVFPKLEACALKWRPQFKSIFECGNLKELALSEYKGKDSHVFSNLTNLRSLYIGQGPLPDIEGLAPLQELTRLQLIALRKLTGLHGLQELVGLKDLRISGCRNMRQIDEISALKKLEILNLADNNIIESIKPLLGLKNLKKVHIYGSTNIEDGDLSPLTTLPRLELKKVGFQNRRHYTHKTSDFRP